MTKEPIVRAMMNRALRLQRKGYTQRGYDQIWDVAYDFNSRHPEQEIFVCYDELEGTEEGVRLYIEDDYFDFD